MAIKTHKVTLSLDNPRVIQSGIKVQSFDKQSIQISIELTKNDEVFQVPSDATIRVSLLKLARQEQKIIVDVPNTNRDSIDWIVPDYLDGYQGTVRVGVYLVSGTENVDLGYFTILSNVSDIDKMADEFTDNVFQGWEQIEADLNELNLTIAQTKLDLADDLTQIDNTIANINAKNTQVNTLASDFTADVATKQSDVTSKYNAFDTSVTTAGQTIDDILALQPQFQAVIDETTGKDVISAPEIILARGGAQTLRERLDSEKAESLAKANEFAAQLAQTEDEVKRKRELEDLSPTVLAAIEGGEDTSFNLLSIPQNESVDLPKLDNYIKKMIGVKPESISWEIATTSGTNGNIRDIDKRGLSSVALIDISNEGLDFYVKEGQGLRFWLAYFDADSDTYNHTFTGYFTSSTKIEPIPNTKARIEFSFLDERELSDDREVLDFISVHRPKMFDFEKANLIEEEVKNLIDNQEGLVYLAPDRVNTIEYGSENRIYVKWRLVNIRNLRDGGKQVWFSDVAAKYPDKIKTSTSGVEGCLTLEDGEILAYHPDNNTVEILPWEGYRSSYICMIYNAFGRMIAGTFLEFKTHSRLKELEENNGGVAESENKIPTYWHPHLNNKIERITQLQNEGGVDSTSFGFITDTHIGDNEQNSGILVEEIMKKCDIPYFIHGGDFVSGSGTALKSSIIDDIRINKEVFGEHFSRILMVEGNHDSAYSANSDEEPIYYYAKNLTPEECYNYYFRHNAVPPQRTVGGNGSYFYQDDNVNKIRYILLNSSDLPHEEDENGYSLKEYNKMRRALMREEQVKWFADVALNVPDSAWGVVVCSHIEPYSQHMPVGNGEITANILQAFKNKTVYSGTSSASVAEEFRFSIDVDFTDKGGNVIVWLSGHMHHDTINRNTPENIDFNIVETLNDSLDRWSDAPQKTPGTDTEQAFDVFTINKKTRTVDVTRIGAGENRQFSY